MVAVLREGELPLLTACKVNSAVKQLEDNSGLGVATHRLFQVLAGGVYAVVDELPEGAPQTVHCLTQAVEGAGQSEGMAAAHHNEAIGWAVRTRFIQVTSNVSVGAEVFVKIDIKLRV